MLRGLRTRVGTLGLWLLVACSSTERDDKNAEPPKDSGGASELLKGHAQRVSPSEAEASSAAKSEQAFAFSFLHALPEDENTAFSPHSMSVAFAMLTDAAQGKTLEEIEQVLHFQPTDEAFHRSQDALMLSLAERNREAVNTPLQHVDAQIRLKIRVSCAEDPDLPRTRG